MCSSQVATRWAYLEHPFVPDLHGARFRAPGFGDVPGTRAGDQHHAGVARFAVIRRDRGGALEGLTIRVDAWWALEDNVAPWHPTDMKPPIVWPGHLEAQRIVVGIGPTDQNLPPPWQRVGEQADLLGVRR